MKTITLTSGSRRVVITIDEGRVFANGWTGCTYEGDGEISPLRWSGKTEAGARRWAAKFLAR